MTGTVKAILTIKTLIHRFHQILVAFMDVFLGDHIGRQMVKVADIEEFCVYNGLLLTPIHW